MHCEIQTLLFETVLSFDYVIDGPVNGCLSRSAFKGGDCHNSDIGGFRRMTEIPEGQPRANPEKRPFDS